MKTETLWLVLGLIGQTCFFMRFIVQWICSERQKRSVIPIAFWYFSIGGAAILLTYSIHRQDPVFILGQSGGFVIYTRNLVLLGRGDEVLELLIPPPAKLAAPNSWPTLKAITSACHIGTPK